LKRERMSLFGWANQPAAAAAGLSPHKSTIATVRNSQLQPADWPSRTG